MKILKILGGLIGLLVLAFLIIGLVSRKDFITSQSRMIKAPVSQVFNTVNDLSTWEKWSPWKEEDPTITAVMGTPHVGKGGNYSWTSDKMGAGSLLITNSIKDELIENEMDFGPQGTAKAKFTFDAKDGGTAVTWHFHSHVDFPWNTFMVFMGMEKMMDKSYSRGLELLENYVGSLPKSKSEGLSENRVDF